MSELLLARIRGEYREMPGLRLTFKQACRMWQLAPAECDAALQTLLTERFLCRTAEEMFVALPTPRAVRSKPLPAALQSRAMVLRKTG